MPCEAALRGDGWCNDADLIFATTFGRPLDPGDFGKGVPRITEKVGLGHRSIHELRHSCASLMFSMDVPLEAVADQLGHGFTGVTNGVHMHLLPGSRAKAPGVVSIVATAGTDVVGFTYFQTDGAIQAHLSLLAVEAAHRRAGAARALLPYAFPLLAQLA
jgi:hypothetical protein